jgi:hypothetical protein
MSRAKVNLGIFKVHPVSKASPMGGPNLPLLLVRFDRNTARVNVGLVDFFAAKTAGSENDVYSHFLSS